MREARLPSARAPLIGLLAGLMTGLSLATCFPDTSLPILLSASLALATAALALAQQSKLDLRWWLTFYVATILGAWAYGIERLPRVPDLSEMALPEREVQLVLEVDRILDPEDRYGLILGFGRVRERLSPSKLIRGDPVYFSLQNTALPDDAILQGAQVQLTAVQSFVSSENVRGFERYLNDQGIYYRLSRVSKVHIIQEPGFLSKLYDRTNQRFQNILGAGGEDHQELEQVYTAMLLGLKSELSAEQKILFRESGTMHFFAISGLHIGVIATAIAQLLLLVRVPRHIRPWIGLPLLYFYVQVTGGAPSAVRAFLMAAFFWASLSLRRQGSSFPALIGSALFVLIWDPLQLFSAGFQLSYAVVASILLCGLPLHAYLKERVQPFSWLPLDDWSPIHKAIALCIDGLLLLFAISLSAWLASAPLSAGYFGFVGPQSVFLNMMLVHLAALAITTGVISLFLGLLGFSLVSGFINHAALLVISAMQKAVLWSEQIIGSYDEAKLLPLSFSHGSLVLYFAILLWLHRDRTRLNTLKILIAPVALIVILSLGFLWF